MTSFFTFAPNEMTSGSIYFLGSIFGVVGPVLAGGGPAIFGVMFNVFNTAVLAIGTMIITYTSGMSIVLTAHEGEMLGKKFHSLWVPMRTVMGMAALVPAATGYSYLQIALMWFILQGVGAADTLWTATVNYVATHGSLAPNTSAQVANAAASGSLIRNKLSTLFQGLACQAAQKASGLTSSTYLCSGPNRPEDFCNMSDTDMLNVVGGPMVDATNPHNQIYQMGFPKGTCGTLTLGDPAANAALINAYQLIIPTLGGIAAQLVNIDDAYSNFMSPNAPTGAAAPAAPDVANYYCSTHHSSQCTPTTFQGYGQPNASSSPPSYVGIVKDIYLPFIRGQLGDFLTTQAIILQSMTSQATATAAAENPNSVRPELTDNGWIYAGAFFYELARSNRTTSLSGGDITVTGPGTVAPASAARLVQEASTLMQSMPQATSQTAGTIHVGACTIFGVIPLGDTCDNIVQSWMSSMSGQSGDGGTSNPIVSAQAFGTICISVAEATVEIAVVILLGMLALGTIVVGNGVPVFPLFMEILVMPALFFFVGIFIGIGGTLAVYTPLIPFMLFAFGAINWIIATIETMIAAPIVAIGILYPEGGHDLWGKAEKAIELVLNIFLRPSLMIFGMVAALLLSYVSITLVNQSFIYTVNEIVMGSYNGSQSSAYGSASGHTGIIEMVLFMVFYTSIFTTVMGKCFELIHVIPDKILRWIGGGGESFGDAGQDAGKVGQGFQSGADKTAGAAKGAGESASSAQQTKKSQFRAQHKGGAGEFNSDGTSKAKAVDPGGTPPSGGTGGTGGGTGGAGGGPTPTP